MPGLNLIPVPTCRVGLRSIIGDLDTNAKGICRTTSPSSRVKAVNTGRKGFMLKANGTILRQEITAALSDKNLLEPAES